MFTGEDVKRKQDPLPEPASNVPKQMIAAYLVRETQLESTLETLLEQLSKLK